MEDLIISETNKIFSKAIRKYASSVGESDMNVSVLLRLKDDGEVDDETGEVVRRVDYWLCKNHRPEKNVGIMEILGVKIDLRGYSILVPPQIKKILERFESETGSRDIDVVVYLNREMLWETPEDEEEDLAYFLFVGGKRNKKFKLEQVLNLQVT